MQEQHQGIGEVDPEAAEIISDEIARQRNTLAMIASENYASPAVMRAQGSVFTNKYAEGYPGERYYAGCKNADRIENLAIGRAKRLWGAEHINVQPHSGTQANIGVISAFLDPGDKIMCLNLNGGGHLSHGASPSFTGKTYTVERYAVDSETGTLNYDAIAEQAATFEPDLIVSGYSAYPRIVDWERMQEVAEVNDAIHLADIAHITGLVATGVHPSPVGVADVVTGSTHKTIRAGRGGIVMTNDKEYADAIDSAVFPGAQGGPLMHNIAGKAVGFKQALESEFEEYTEQIVENARSLGDGLQERDLTLISGGTDTHLVLADLRKSHPDMSGLEAHETLEDVGIVANRNRVPEESRQRKWSGIRFGTPVLTLRGFDADDCRELGELIVKVLDNPSNEAVLDEGRTRVREFCNENPIYEGRNV